MDQLGLRETYGDPRTVPVEAFNDLWTDAYSVYGPHGPEREQLRDDLMDAYVTEATARVEALGLEPGDELSLVHDAMYDGAISDWHTDEIILGTFSPGRSGETTVLNVVAHEMVEHAIAQEQMGGPDHESSIYQLCDIAETYEVEEGIKQLATSHGKEWLQSMPYEELEATIVEAEEKDRFYDEIKKTARAHDVPTGPVKMVAELASQLTTELYEQQDDRSVQNFRDSIEQVYNRLDGYPYRAGDEIVGSMDLYTKDRAQEEAVQTMIADIDTLLETDLLYPELPHLENRLGLLIG